MQLIKRGDIFYADLRETVKSEAGGIRPVIVIQNDIGNKYLPTVIVAPITSNIHKGKIQTHILISQNIGLPADGQILVEQIRAIDKTRLIEKIGHIDNLLMNKVDEAIYIAAGINNQ